MTGSRPSTGLARVALLVLAVLAACEARGARKASSVAQSADDLFGERLVPRFELELSLEAQASLRDKPKKWAHGTFRYAGKTYDDVAVRLKGNRSRRGLDDKPSFKIRFDKFVPDRTFLGVRELVLNNLVEDPTLVREALAYRLHRELGVAAPRTGWAELVVNEQRYGLYLNVEAPDEAFLADRYGGDGDGSLYEGEYGCDLYPDDAARFEQDGGKDVAHADLVALATRAATDPDALFDDDGPLDVPRVVAFLAVSAVIGDFDGYRHGHNYRIYRDPEDGKWSLLPWGLDRSFKKRLAFTDSAGFLARRCFADPTCRVAYGRAVARAQAALAKLVDSGLIDRWSTITDAGVHADVKKPYDAAATRAARKALRDFVSERAEDVRREAACLVAAPPASCASPPPTCTPASVAGVAMLLCTTPLTWSDAEAYCRSQGRHLARLDGDAESEALAQAVSPLAKDRWWIGLTDRAREGEFLWTDGTAPAAPRWRKKQPDDAACGEDCTTLVPKKKGAWADAHCEQPKPFVCR